MAEHPKDDPEILPALTKAVDTAIIEARRCTDWVTRIPSLDVWRRWSDEWISGNRNPQFAVDAAHAVSHDCAALCQIAWAAKEACYPENPQAPWLVIRYIADAAIELNLPFKVLDNADALRLAHAAALLPPPETL